MKLLVQLVVAFFLIGCNSANKPSTEVSQNDKGVLSEQEVKQWLSIPGKTDMPKIVLVSGDEEYRSEEALPQLAKILSQRHGFNCTVLFAQDSAELGIVDPNYRNNIPGLDQLASADLMILFTRFRALPDDQMKHIDAYLKSGKPVVGIRTATHGFFFKEADFDSNYKHYGNYSNSEDEWKDGFGRLVMGEHWISHHGNHGNQSTKGIVAPGAEGHSILNGISAGSIWGPTDVYGVRLPLPDDSQPIILGQVTERIGEYDENDPRLGMRPTDSIAAGVVMRKNKEDEEVETNLNDPMMPVAWVKTYQLPEGKPGKTFATTMGSSTDLLTEGTRRMMVNAVYWLLEKEVPEKANVDIVGSYSPSRFAFHKDEYWDDRKLSISSLE